jgi:amino acid adenylation domain-containing protein/thioester reductase-like protein
MKNGSDQALPPTINASRIDRKRLLSLMIAAGRKQRQRNAPTASRDVWNGRLPLSYAQERLWFLDQLGLVGTAYNVPLALRLEGELNDRALEQSVQALVHRHEILRTRYDVHEGVPYQIIEPAGPFELRRIDLSGFSDPHERERHLAERVRREQCHRFDLRDGPPFQASLVCMGDRQSVLLLTMHHIACDGWSLGVLHRDLSALYGGFGQGQASPLLELPMQYADYAIWQRSWIQGDLLQAQLRHWKDRLADAPMQVELPTDRPRPSVESFKGSELRITFPPTLLQALHDVARAEQATLFMVLLAAYQTLLSRWSGQLDIVVGAPIAGRGKREFDDLIGFFVNTLALRTQISDGLSFRQLLHRVRDATLEAYENQDVPFEALVKEVRPERDLARHPIFQVALVVRNYPEERLSLPGLTWTWTEVASVTAHFDLALYLHETPGGLLAKFEYATDLFDESTIRQMAQSLRVILDGVVADPDCIVQRLPVLTGAAQRQVLNEFNETSVAHATNPLLHELFEEQARQRPDEVAVVCGPHQLTYGELDRRANQLAQVLIAYGVGPDTRVGLHLGRSVDLFIGLLATLKSGGAYVPLDVTYPADRIAYMMSDSSPVVLLTQTRHSKSLPPNKARVIVFDAISDELDRKVDEKVGAMKAPLTPAHLAYVIYTSGSTGTPKGVMVTHHGVVNLVRWHCAAFTLQRGDRCSSVAAFGFDAAGWEIWPGLCVGATVLLAPPEAGEDVAALLSWWSSESIDVSFLPTPVAELADSRNIRNETLRALLVGGDRLRYRCVSPPTMLVNNYGPTEATVVATSGLIREEDEVLHIGRPIHNAQTYILDSRLQTVPIGVTGEIYIGGQGLARGYLNRPELTAERFVANPFCATRVSRLYRSGDLARWRADGTIEFLGRGDHQVKVRGVRIELGEVEAQLRQHAQVKDAAVIVRDDPHQDKRLVAYITKVGATDPTVEELRGHLARRLPDYMIPSAFVALESLPLTANGKLDRVSLPMPGVAAYTGKEYAAPESDVERRIVDIWQELLAVDKIGRHDSFFDIGGHSLLVIKMVYQINEVIGCSLTVRDVYMNPTPMELAVRIRAHSTGDRIVDLMREASLDPVIVPTSGSLPDNPQVVLLTGATGFVGRFLLSRLLLDTHAVIYCVVRATSESEAASRLRANLAMWDLWREDFESRLVAISGDLKLPRLGVNELAYDLLCKRVDTIFHCAVSMNHLETYDMARQANVESARDLVRLATSDRAKLINVISTVGVFSSADGDLPRIVDETSSIDQETHHASRGYVSSKWVSEKIFMIAGSRGIPCNIFRLGLVWADAERGRYDQLQREHRILKSCLLSGYGIRDYRYKVSPLPVDYVARAIVLLSDRHRQGRGLFHLAASRGTVDGLFERCNEIAGTSLQLLSSYEWIREIRRLHSLGQSLPVVPLVESSFRLSEEEFNERERAVQADHLRIDCARTERELEDLGIVIPVLSDELIRATVEHMLSRDVELEDVGWPRGLIGGGSRSGSQPHVNWTSS